MALKILVTVTSDDIQTSEYVEMPTELSVTPSEWVRRHGQDLVQRAINTHFRERNEAGE